MFSADGESVVYGYIRFFDDHPLNKRLRVNHAALRRLRVEGLARFLHHEMFNDFHAEAVDLGCQSKVIHFARTYSGVEYEWQSWLDQFERLLREMYWYTCVVHLDTELSGMHTFTWKSSHEHLPGEAIDSSQLEWVRDTY